ncbi:hypothetical protein V22_27840 [Calycomorphotria hydatis]|uniref:Uncharacterized protein n=1 Tax=Calycomorphotria hydatis TaxID=2528027 RepID=A0A517TAY5_9PLAN|nr:hypothetical protein V22_27840 [Calycomorphotria hydatis]
MSIKSQHSATCRKLSTLQSESDEFSNLVIPSRPLPHRMFHTVIETVVKTFSYVNRDGESLELEQSSQLEWFSELDGFWMPVIRHGETDFAVNLRLSHRSVCSNDLTLVTRSELHVSP